MPESPVDILLGTGGAPEGGNFSGSIEVSGRRFSRAIAASKRRRKKEGLSVWALKDPDQYFQLEDLASGDVMFCATGSNRR